MDLINAAKHGDVIRVRELLDSGVNPNIRQYFSDDSPLISASFDGHTEIVKFLLERGADPNIITNNGFTSLIHASVQGHTEIVRLLLENGADPNIRDRYGRTPLMIALNNGNREIARLIKEHIDLQRMQKPQQNLAFMKYFLDRDDLDIDTASKIFSNERSYNPSVHTRMMLEDKQRGRGKRSKGKRSSKKRSGKKKSKTKKKY